MQAIQKLADKVAIDSTLSFRSVVARQNEHGASTKMVSISSNEGLQSKQLANVAVGGFAAVRVQGVTI